MDTAGSGAGKYTSLYSCHTLFRGGNFTQTDYRGNQEVKGEAQASPFLTIICKNGLILGVMSSVSD